MPGGLRYRGSGTDSGHGVDVHGALQIAVAGHDLVVVAHAGDCGGVLVAGGGGVGDQLPCGSVSRQAVNLIEDIITMVYQMEKNHLQSECTE